MKRPRFQFTISGLLGAMFWVAVGAASYSLVQYTPFGGQAYLADFVGLSGGAISPFAALGSLFGPTRRWLVLGIALWILLILLCVALRALGVRPTRFG